MHYIFPTTIWKTNCPLKEEAKKELIYYHNNLKLNTKGKNYSNSTWQSQDIFSENIVFKPIIEIITQNVAILKEELFKKNNFDLTSIWFNSHEMGSYNRMHSHGLCGLSGVYYLNCPDGSGKIVFERNPFEKNIIDFSWNLCDPNFEARKTSFEVIPKEGDLLFFPSWLLHWVDRSTVLEDRISIAFNISLN